MTEIGNLDLGAYVTEAVSDVFDMMLSMETEVFTPDEPPHIDGARITASVGITGDVVGTIIIQLKYDFAHLITATMLDMELDDIEGPEEIKDVIGELGNMIGGSVKSHFCDSDLPCVLSIPSITYGSDFKVTIAKGTRCERFYFRHPQEVSLVELYLKPGT